MTRIPGGEVPWGAAFGEALLRRPQLQQTRGGGGGTVSQCIPGAPPRATVSGRNFLLCSWYSSPGNGDKAGVGAGTSPKSQAQCCSP